MEETTLKNRLEVGEKIFYFDGQTQWDIETVESVNKSEKSVDVPSKIFMLSPPTTPS